MNPRLRAGRPTVLALAAWFGTVALAGCAATSVPGEPAARSAQRVPYGPPRQIATLANRAINESSGLAASHAHPGVFWTHNDSGDAARLYALDRAGRHLATCTLQGTEADDWEDIASFRRGKENLLIVSDAGDNRWSRSTCTLYVLAEPAVGTPEKPVSATVPVRRSIEFVYEDGPRDCEAVAVDASTGRIYLATKEGLACRVYELRVPPDPANAPAKTANPSADASDTAPADGSFAKPLTARPIGTIPAMLVVAMDMSPDGRRAVVLTYGDAMEFVRAEGETWREAFGHLPRTLPMPQRSQGESICYGPDGRTLYLTSEHTPTPLLEVPVAPPDKDKTP